MVITDASISIAFAMVWLIASNQARMLVIFLQAGFNVLAWLAPGQVSPPSEIQVLVLFAAGAIFEKRAALCLRMRAISALQIFATQRYDAIGQVQRLLCAAVFAGYLLSGMSSLFSFSLKLIGFFVESNRLTRNVLNKPRSVQSILESPLVQELASDHGIVDSSFRVTRRISELMQAYPEFRPTAGTDSDDVVQCAIDGVAEFLQSSFSEFLMQNAPVRKMGLDFVKGVLPSMGAKLDDAEFIGLVREFIEDPEAAFQKLIGRDPLLSMMMAPFMGGAGRYDGTGVPNSCSDPFMSMMTGSFMDGAGAFDGRDVPNGAGQARPRNEATVARDVSGVRPFQGQGRMLSE